jgi:hypothetical protein
MAVKDLKSDKPKNPRIIIFDQFWTEFRTPQCFAIDISEDYLPVEVKRDVKLIEDFGDWMKLWLREENNKGFRKENLKCLIDIITYVHVTANPKSQQGKLDLCVPIRYNEIPNLNMFKVYNFIREKFFGLPQIPEQNYLNAQSKTMILVNTYGHE